MSLVTLMLLENLSMITFYTVTTLFLLVKLHNLYKTGVDNVNARAYRSKLKDRMKSEFGNQLLFLTINSATPQVVVSLERITITSSLRTWKKS